MAYRLLLALRGERFNPHRKWQGPHWTPYSLDEAAPNRLTAAGATATYTRPMRRIACALVAMLALVSCAEHDHGDDFPGEHHDVRDPASEPCDSGNWRDLLPDLRQCDLVGEVLAGENLRRTDLTEATLDGASVEDADLFKAVLASASLADANLTGAKLISADLTDADLTRASLKGAVLTNAKLTGALLDGTITDETTVCPDGTPGPCW